MPYERVDGSLILGESPLPDTRHLSLWEYYDMFKTDEMSTRLHRADNGVGMEITLEHPDTGPGWEASIFLGFDYDEAAGDLVPKWTYWTMNHLSDTSAFDGGGSYVDVCWYDDGVWRTEVVIPDNVPSDGLFMWAKIREESSFDNIRSNFVDNIDHAELQGRPDDDGQPPEKILAGLLLLVGTVIVAIVISRRTNDG